MTNKKAVMILESIQPSCGEKYSFSESEIYEAIDMAIEALEGNDMAKERKYTFGNGEFNLEAAYHDCKLVFDGITDDSFQEADTGLILYYANEIIYALHEALEGKDTNVPSNDTISRQATITEIKNYERDSTAPIDYVKIVEQMPSAQPERPKDIIQNFHDYQVEWLKSHCDIELEPELEMLIVRFLNDTANCYIMEIER